MREEKRTWVSGGGLGKRRKIQETLGVRSGKKVTIEEKKAKEPIALGRRLCEAGKDLHNDDRFGSNHGLRKNKLRRYQDSEGDSDHALDRSEKSRAITGISKTENGKGKAEVHSRIKKRGIYLNGAIERKKYNR